MRPLARALALLGTALAGAGAASAQLPAQLPAGVRAIEWRHALPADGLVRLWNPTGSVRVVAWDQDSVVVTGDAPEDVPFYCGAIARGVKCAANVPPSEEASAKPAHLEVRVPRHTSVWVKSASADISIQDAAGNVEAYSVTGTIHVAGRAHTVQVETMGGDIEVAGSAEALRARTADGAILLSADAEDVDVSSVSGSVRVTGGVRHGRVESIDGALHWHASPPAGARIELISHNGDIDVKLSRGAGGVFQVNSYRGRVSCGASAATAARTASGETTCTLPPVRDVHVSIRNFKGAISIARE